MFYFDFIRLVLIIFLETNVTVLLSNYLYIFCYPWISLLFFFILRTLAIPLVQCLFSFSNLLLRNCFQGPNDDLVSSKQRVLPPVVFA